MNRWYLMYYALAVQCSLLGIRGCSAAGYNTCTKPQMNPWSCLESFPRYTTKLASASFKMSADLQPVFSPIAVHSTTNFCSKLVPNSWSTYFPIQFSNRFPNLPQTIACHYCTSFTNPNHAFFAKTQGMIVFQDELHTWSAQLHPSKQCCLQFAKAGLQDHTLTSWRSLHWANTSSSKTKATGLMQCCFWALIATHQPSSKK